MGKLDTIVGGVLNLSTTGGIIVLNAAQLACGTILVTGALAGNYVITFPDIQGWWTIGNFTTNISTGVVGIISGAQTRTICIPPGELVDIQINGNIPSYRNLGRIGGFLDLPVTTVPLWISACTINPYLVCNGSAFDGTIYPYLVEMLGGTTLPDFRGRSPFFLNSGSGRLTSGGAGIDGNTLFATGGADGVMLAANQVPTISSVNASQAISVSSTATVPKNYSTNTVGTPGSGTPVAFPSGNDIGILNSSGNNSISVAYTNASQQKIGNAAPGIVSGIRLIRAG